MPLASHEKTCKTDIGGFFTWDTCVLEKIDAVNFKGVKHRKDKQLHLAGYLLELAYDLALSSLHNVSKNPGFETPLGVWSQVE